MSKATMVTVAQKAGVSTATVSHVLNNTRYVSENVRQKVLTAVKELNYSPNIMARSLKTNRYNVIAVIVSDIVNPYFSTIIEKIGDVVAENGFQMIVANTKESEQLEVKNLKALSSGMIDGFIIASTMTSFHAIAKIMPDDMPMVFIDRSIADCPCDTVTISTYDAMYQGVMHFIQRGHKKIGFINGLARLSTAIERLKAYQDAMRDCDLAYEDLVMEVNPVRSMISVNVGQFLAQGCTALVFANSVIGTQAMLELQNLGVDVEKDMEFLGYKESNFPQYGLQYMNLICQPSAELARISGEQIIRRINNPNCPVNKIIIPATFVPKSLKYNTFSERKVLSC